MLIDIQNSELCILVSITETLYEQCVIELEELTQDLIDNFSEEKLRFLLEKQKGFLGLELLLDKLEENLPEEAVEALEEMDTQAEMEVSAAFSDPKTRN